MSAPCQVILVVSHSYCVQHNRGKLYELAKLFEAGEVHLLVPSSWSDNLQESSYQCQNEEDQGLKVVALPASEAGSIRRFCFNRGELKDYLERLKPRLILGELEPGSRALGQLFYYAKKLRPRPVLNFFTWENLRGDFLSGGAFGNYKFLDKWLVRYNLKSADGAIAGNNRGRKILAESLMFKGAVLECPQLGLDERKKEQLPVFPTDEMPFNVIFSGRIVEAKGVSVLLEAVKKCTARVQLYFLGKGGALDSLKQRVTESQLNQRVHFKGSLPHKEAEAFLETGHLLVLPSLTTKSWKEQLGHVLLEAMSVGVPVVGSHSGAIPDVIKDTGLIVDEGNADKLATAITKMASDKAFWLDCQTKGQKRVAEQFTNKRLAQKLYAWWQGQGWL